MKKVLCVLAILGMAGVASAANDWDGGGDGTTWSDGNNWDDPENVPPGASDNWTVNSSWNNGDWSIVVDQSWTCGGGTILAGYTVNLTIPAGVTLTQPSGGLAYYSAGTLTVESGAFYDMRYGELGLQSGSLTVTIQAGGELYCSTLRHNNGAMVDVYGQLRAWTVSRISAEGTYRLAVHDGGLFRVDDSVPTTGGWSEGGKVTQYRCSTVKLIGDHTSHYLDLVQAGETGVWDVYYSDPSYEGDGYTYIWLPETDPCDFTATPSSIEAKPGAACAGNPQNHEITVTNTMAGGADVNYTITVLDRNGVEVEITEVPWLSLDKLSGGPIAPSGTDIVTAKVDFTQLEVGLNMATLRFTSDCDTCEYHDVEIMAPFIVRYQGDVDPEVLNAAGPGMRFTEKSGDSSDADLYRNTDPPGLVVQEDLDTLDGYTLHIADGPDKKLKLRTAPSQNIGGTTGATIVGRVRTTFKFGASGENLSIWHDGGGTVGYHWSGAGDVIHYQYGDPGYIKETARGADYTITGKTPEWYASYHILRASMGDDGGSRAVRLYFDEKPTPVIELKPASNSSATPDALGLGTGSTAGQQAIYFDWVTGTNAGMFAPGAELACIGQTLCLGPGCSACHNPFADADNDGDVDHEDFAVLQICMTGSAGPVPAEPEYCFCFDQRDSAGNQPVQNDNVDEFDVIAFENCASGPGVPADPTCDDPAE